MTVFTRAYHVIAVRIILAMDYAVPAAVLCVNRHLYMLASPPISIILSKAEKNRELIIDLAIGIGLPIIGMVLCLSSNFPFISLWLIHVFSVSRSRRSISDS